MHATRNDIPSDSREKLIGLLNARLADTIDLYLQTKYAHWNVKGPNFIALHKLFDEIAEELNEYIDEIAERATALGGRADGTIQLVGKKSSLSAYPTTISNGKDHLEALANAFAAFGKTVRAAIDQSDSLNDKDTADLFTQISRNTDMRLWFLEAHLQADK
jgi:starvation-inducible DNA-binding protein